MTIMGNVPGGDPVYLCSASRQHEMFPHEMFPHEHELASVSSKRGGRWTLGEQPSAPCPLHPTLIRRSLLG